MYNTIKLCKMAIMEIFSDFQVYIEEDQDTREVFIILDNSGDQRIKWLDSRPTSSSQPVVMVSVMLKYAGNVGDARRGWRRGCGRRPRLRAGDASPANPVWWAAAVG